MLEFGPQVGAYGAVGIALLLLFRVVFRTLAVKDTGVEQLLRRLTNERDRSQRWERYHAQRADHWYAKALGDPNPPPHPEMPRDPDDDPGTVPFIPPPD